MGIDRNVHERVQRVGNAGRLGRETHEDHWQPIGVHLAHPSTVDTNSLGAMVASDHLMVRFFVRGRITDEGFDLPVLPPGVERTEGIYAAMLHNTIEARFQALGGGAPARDTWHDEREDGR
jgi:hypothetical protein